MNQNHKVLTYNGRMFVDILRLYEGIYATLKPIKLSSDTTIESILKSAEQSLADNLIDKDAFDTYKRNLSKCQLEDYNENINKPVEPPATGLFCIGWIFPFVGLYMPHKFYVAGTEEQAKTYCLEQFKKVSTPKMRKHFELQIDSTVQDIKEWLEFKTDNEANRCSAICFFIVRMNFYDLIKEMIKNS